ncbi:hypothetical protein KC19_5G104200 [Ceratodon purpureus]|uniref:Uncharacterized protein n=1 Tax=Ceratodon purpureus TaxID=3225 RepID=A0A8T0I1C8_CERPU|nr:hypothetical protein KC19_5G104200 [Ceratodon purpureus]
MPISEQPCCGEGPGEGRWASDLVPGDLVRGLLLKIQASICCLSSAVACGICRCIHLVMVPLHIWFLSF